MSMFVPILLIISFTWPLSDATSCTSVTGRTCKKSKFVTGTCSNDVCTCVTGYESVRTGCVEKLKPSVEIVAVDGGNPEQTAKGNGEALFGGKIKLLCLPVTSGAGYIWSVNSKNIPELTSNALDLTKLDSSHSAPFRSEWCKIKVASADYTSDTSDSVTLRLIQGDGSAIIKPDVSALYKRSMMNAVVSFTCVNITSGIVLSYEWYVAGIKVNNPTQSYSMTMTNKTLSQNITCKVVRNERTGNISFTSVESTPVFLPSSLTDDITGVYIEETSGGGSIFIEVDLDLQLHCKIVDTDLAIVQTTVVYSWTKDGTSIGMQSDTFNEKATTAHSGVYKCIVTMGTLPAKESAGLSVIVDEVMGKVTVASDPSTVTPLLNGYLSIQCIVEARNMTSVKYKWIKDNVFIDRQTDNLIQINSVRNEDAGSYQCEASIDLVHYRSTAYSVPTPVSFDAVTLQAPTSDKLVGDVFGLGNTYTLTCSNRYETPGMTYQWMRGSQPIPGETAKTYNITATSGVTLYSCLIAFSGNFSKPSPNINIDAKSMTRISIQLAGLIVSNTTIKPLIDAEVNLECQVTVATDGNGEMTYAWLRAEQLVTSQNSRNYRFNASANSDGQIKCRATLGNDTLTSDAVTVASAAQLEAPSVTIANYDVTVSDKAVYVEGASYIMFCITASHTSGVQYTWLKEDTAITGTSTRTYTIAKAKKGPNGDSGVYSCKATLGKASVSSKNTLTINITDAGRPCKYASDCLGNQYTTNCINNRCECAVGLKFHGNTCNSSADMATAAASVLLLMLTVAIWWM